MKHIAISKTDESKKSPEFDTVAEAVNWVRIHDAEGYVSEGYDFKEVEE